MYISCIQLEIFASKYRKPQYINFSEMAVNCTNIMYLATYLIYKDTEVKFHTHIEYSIPYKENIKLDLYMAERESAQMSKITNDG